MTTGMFRVADLAFKRLVTSSPFKPGSRNPNMIRWGRMLQAASIASNPDAASQTSYPKPLINEPSDSRPLLSSSTISIFFAGFRIEKGKSIRDARRYQSHTMDFWVSNGDVDLFGAETSLAVAPHKKVKFSVKGVFY